MDVVAVVVHFRVAAGGQRTPRQILVLLLLFCLHGLFFQSIFLENHANCEIRDDFNTRPASVEMNSKFPQIPVNSKLAIFVFFDVLVVTSVF